MSCINMSLPDQKYVPDYHTYIYIFFIAITDITGVCKKKSMPSDLNTTNLKSKGQGKGSERILSQMKLIQKMIRNKINLFKKNKICLQNISNSLNLSYSLFVMY